MLTCLGIEDQDGAGQALGDVGLVEEFQQHLTVSRLRRCGCAGLSTSQVRSQAHLDIVQFLIYPLPPIN